MTVISTLNITGAKIDPSTGKPIIQDLIGIGNETVLSGKERRKAAREVRRRQKAILPTSRPTAEATVSRLVEEGQKQLGELDDYSSAWEACKAEGRSWGGKAQGGRGVARSYQCMSSGKTKDAVVNQVTLAFDGHELLRESRLCIAHRHRYGLIGKNGVGKTTLLRRIAAKAVPGWPMHLSTLYVQQEVFGSRVTVLECLLNGNPGEQAALEEEKTRLEETLVEPYSGENANSKEAAALRLGEIYDLLESDSREAQAVNILKGLQFSSAMRAQPTDELSGGWRMRLALAQALFVRPDILLLDEPTNHLDLSAVAWLEQFLTNNSITTVIVSHDAYFLDAVCTDIINFEDQKLNYHAGNYSNFRGSQDEKFTRARNTADAVAKKEKKMKDFIQKQQAMSNKKGGDENKQRQAAERAKKMGRVGLFSENGHRFKLLAVGRTKSGYESSGASNRAQHITGNYRSSNGMQSQFVSNAKVGMGFEKNLLNFKFPAAAPIGSAGVDLPLISMEECSFGYTARKPLLLNKMTLSINRKSRIAVVGRNGAGKSTLIKLLVGELQPKTSSVGKYFRHPNCKVAHIAQHHIEQVGEHVDKTPMEFLMCEHKSKSEQEARAFLGSFGLVGKLALQKIGSLSGGQKARLVFATVMFQKPHVLVLDEPTNHLDTDSLESLSRAVGAFRGAVVMVSHNQSFMAGCCNEMWVLQKGRVSVNRAHEEGEGGSFTDIFRQYKRSLAAACTGS
jgi:ATPase subunit of ABC transporter with duplicated ATPase domains